MAKEKEPEAGFKKVPVDKVGGGSQEPPLGATWAAVSRAGHDILLEVGYTDVAKLANDMVSGAVRADNFKLRIKVVGTYLLTPRALANLFASAKMAYEGLEGEMGTLLPDEAKGDVND